jgi:hypothetical protein
MAVIEVPKLKNTDPIPQTLYTPKIKVIDNLDENKLYTPKLSNNIILNNTQEVPKPKNEKIKIPLYTPEPELFEVEIPLYTPNPKLQEVRDFLIIPNPNEIDADISIYPPDPNNEDVDLSLYPPNLSIELFDFTMNIPKKIPGRWIPNYAYDFKVEEVEEISLSLYDYEITEKWPFYFSYEGATSEEQRGLNDEWIDKWEAIEELYAHTKNRDDFFYLQIMPYNIELPKNAYGEIKELNWNIPIVKLPKKYMYKLPYMSYKRKGDKWADAFSSSNSFPNPNFNQPEPPASQGWNADAQEARNEQFMKEWKEMWSAENLLNVGKEMAKGLIKDLGPKMFSMNGEDSSSGSSVGIKSTPPHIYSYVLDGAFSEKNESLSWLGSKGKLKPAKFNYDKNHANHPMTLLNAIGPDFMKHKFDAYFVLYDETGKPSPIDFDKEKWMTPFQKFIYDHKGFAVRFGTVNIPATSKEEFAVKWMETEVRKIRTSIIHENKATFSFRMDQNLFWLDFVDKMAGHNNTLDQLSLLEKKRGTGESPYENYFYLTKGEGDSEEGKFSWQDAIKYVSQSYLSSANRNLCLVIKMSHLSDFIHTGTQQRMLPYFVFDDIKILGTSNSISYEREGSSIHNMNVNFIFKFLYEVYSPNTSNKQGFEYTSNTKKKGDFGTFSLLGLIDKDENITKASKLPLIYTYESIFGSIK